MAPATGMAGFVKGRNGDATPDLTDLKIPAPGAKQERKQKSKQNTAAPREKSLSGRQSRAQENASLKSNNSSAENLSTTASTSRQRSGREQRLETRSNTYERHGTNGDQHPGIFGGTDFDEEPDNDQELPEEALDVTKEKNFQKMLTDSREPMGGPTIAQTRVKGDSYPPTSNGVPSVTDQHDRGEVRAPNGLQNLPTHAAERSFYSVRTPGQQLQHATTRQQLHTASHAQRQVHAPVQQLQDAKALDSEPASEYDTSAGFSFGRAPQVKKEVAVHPSRPQRQAVKQRPLAAEVKAEAPRPHREADKQAAAQAGTHMNDHLIPAERHAYRPERQPRVAEIQDHHHQNGASTGQAIMPDQGPTSDALTEEDPVEQSEQQDFSEEVLDHGLQELYNKDYSSLKAEPFDHQPNAQLFVVPDLPESAAVTDKLAHLTRAGSETQTEFFASLNIDEWEEAGDWFLDRFGDTIKKLKDVRREKRKAARAFEDEIEVRETAVSKKRALTNVAMADMKSSGAAVLQGTPGKKR